MPMKAPDSPTCCIRALVSVCATTLLCVPASARPGDTVRDILFARGIAAYDAGRYDEAARAFREILSSAPTDAESRRALALSLSGAGDFGEGVRLLRELHRERPDDFETGAELCLALALAGDFGETEDLLRGLDARAGDGARRAEISFLRGVLAGERGNHAEALTLLADAAASDAAAASRARYYRGVYLARSGDRDAARRELAMLGERAPTAAIGRMAGRDADLLARPPDEKQWGGKVTARYEYDDNVMLAPDNEQLLGVSGSGDWRFLTTFELDAPALARGPFELDTRYAFVQSVHNRLGDFNLHGHVGDAWVRYRGSRATPFLGYEYAYYLLDDCRQSYLRGNRLFGGLDIPVASRAFYRLTYTCSLDDYMLPYGPSEDDWDTEPANAVSLEQYLFLGRERKAFWRTALRYDHNNARGDNFYYHGGALAGELYVPLGRGFAADLEAGYLVYDYTRNADNRADQRLDLNADLRKNLFGDTDLVFSYAFIRNMSNVSLYQFSRNIYSLILETRF